MTDDDSVEECPDCYKIAGFPCTEHKCAKPDCKRIHNNLSLEHFCTDCSCEHFGCKNYPLKSPDCKVHSTLFGGDDGW